MFEFDELVAAEAAYQGQCLLGKTLLEAQLADVHPDALTTIEPSLLTLGLDSISARWHETMPR